MVTDKKSIWWFLTVSTLVLMDSWINGTCTEEYFNRVHGFNPCFNGFMDKWTLQQEVANQQATVSTLVLMDSWINGASTKGYDRRIHGFQPLF